jgi:anti-sigma B factor antagonist
MGGGMVVDLATGDGFVVVSLSGELDLSEATGLRNTLARLVQSGTPLIVVNAAELSFLDSSGIGVLVATANQQTASDAVLVIANLSELTGRPVRLTEVDTAIPVHWGEEKAEPWAEPNATPESILLALGFAEVATRPASDLDISAEPIA